MKALKVMISILCMFELSAQAVVLKSKSGEVKFMAIGKPGFLKIRGESAGQKPEGSIEIKQDTLSGQFVFDLKNLKTGIDLRDEHMKEKYLEVGKFPQAKLVIKPMPVKESDLAGDIKKDFAGTLTLHGVTKDVSGKVEYKGSSKKLSAQFTVQVSDFSIAVPEYMGVTVSQKVDVDIAMELAP